MTRDDIIRLAESVKIKASIGQTDPKDKKYRPNVNALGKHVPVEWLENFAAAVADELKVKPRLTVKLCSFPESNGRRNWTAMITRDRPWSGLLGNCGGGTIDRGEYWNRIAYAAEQARFLLGERDTEPHILDYSTDIDTPDQWSGEKHAIKSE